MPFRFKPINPKVFKDSAFRLEFLTGMRDSGAALAKEFKRTTKTWVGDKPSFEHVDQQKGNTLILDMVMTGSEAGINKWLWLAYGTKVRYATMSQDWKSKTQVNVLDSGSGKGRKLFVSKKHPRPGIKARRWPKIIAKDFKKPYQKRMEEAMRRAAASSGHKYK